jgi:outer membrane receptor protein involved in Fe transport
MRQLTRAFVVAAAAVCLAGAAQAQQDTENPPTAATEPPIEAGEESIPSPADDSTRLKELVVEGKKPVSAASSDEISAKTFELRPHETMQDVLNNVPGLIVRQHQGGGKATQYLIRGFNADHGTDFRVMLDGLPVNLTTHAHGQGYADSNFIIPETIQSLQLRKGPYFPELGDLAVAGALDIVTKETFDENFLLAEGGSFDRMRYVAGGSPRIGGLKTLLAGQAYYSNGPFINDENFARYNLYAKATAEPTPDSRLWAAASLYAADWDASGQIPQRSVSLGGLDRFGSLDPTEGGRSGRENLDVHYELKPTPQDTWSLQGYASRYKLRLWSDFTFFQDTGLRFLETADGRIVDTGAADSAPFARAIPGDGIEQNDFRWLFGTRGSYQRTYDLKVPMASKVGLETQNDDIDVAVYRQVKRNRFFTVSKANVSETTVGAYLFQEIFFTDWLRFEGGLRGDVFRFDVSNRLNPQPSDPDFDPVPVDGRDTDHIVSPKANLVITPEPNTDVYLNFGTGFHSNDARGVIQGKQEGDRNVVPLARALGYEIGSRTRQLDRIDAAAALWLVDLDSEVVYCGDCGTIERNATGSFDAGASTRRWGIDFETRFEITRWLYADYDLSYADPRFKKTDDAIPLAPTLFMNGGLTADFRNGFSAAWRARFLDDRPGNETRTIPARGYFIMDLLAKYRWKNVEASIAFLNFADFDWQEAVFVDTSCTKQQASGQNPNNPCPGGEQIHFTPGDPFGVRAGVKLFF